MGAELFHGTDRQAEGQTDRQTGMTKPTVAFRNFANAPKWEPVGVSWLEVVQNTMHWRVPANMLTKVRVA